MTFDELDREADRLPSSDPVCHGVNSLIAHADDNGTDEPSKMASLQTLLAYATAPGAAPVREWFKARGVTW